MQTGKEQLGVRSFGLSVTTLEEVFLKIASEDETFGNTPDGSPRGPLEAHPVTPGFAPGATLTPAFPLPPSAADTALQLQLNPQLLSSPALRLSFHERRRPRVADPLNCPRRRGYGRWWCQFRACVVKHVRTAVREPWAAATQVRSQIM